MMIKLFLLTTIVLIVVSSVYAALGPQEKTQKKSYKDVATQTDATERVTDSRATGSRVTDSRPLNPGDPEFWEEYKTMPLPELKALVDMYYLEEKKKRDLWNPIETPGDVVAKYVPPSRPLPPIPTPCVTTPVTPRGKPLKPQRKPLHLGKNYTKKPPVDTDNNSDTTQKDTIA